MDMDFIFKKMVCFLTTGNFVWFDPWCGFPKVRHENQKLRLQGWLQRELRLHLKPGQGNRYLPMLPWLVTVSNDKKGGGNNSKKTGDDWPNHSCKPWFKFGSTSQQIIPQPQVLWEVWEKMPLATAISKTWSIYSWWPKEFFHKKNHWGCFFQKNVWKDVMSHLKKLYTYISQQFNWRSWFSY